MTKTVKTQGEVKITINNQEMTFNSNKIALKELTNDKGQLLITDESENIVISVIFTK